MQGRSEAEEGRRSAHLRDYWKVIWQGRYTVLAVLVLVLGLSILRVFLATPIYQATATVEIKPEARTVLPGQEQWVGAEGRTWIAEELYFNTQLSVLRSRALAEYTFNRLDLDTNPRFADASDPVGAFAAMIDVRPKVNTRLVEISMSGPDPTEITGWVNELAASYVKRNVEEAKKSFDVIMDRITRGMEEFRTDLGASDLARYDSAQADELLVPEDQRDILRKNLEAYNRELADLQMKISGLEAELDGYERIRREGGDFTSLPRFSQDPLIQGLNTSRLAVARELEQIGKEKTPRHPEYLKKSGDLDKIHQDLMEQVDQVAGQLREEYRLARANAANLEKEIRSIEQRAHALERAATNYGLLKTDAESKRRVYDVVAESIQQLRIGAQLIYLNNNVAVLDEAIEPTHPVKPRKAMAAATGLFLGLFAGVGLVLFLDYLDNTIRTPEDVEQSLGLNVLAVVPKYRDVNSQAVREAYQSLRTSLLFSSHNLEKRVLLFSSAGPQEGKSNTVNHVSRALASAGDRVIVVDCDLRRPTMDKHLQVPREPGITNYLLTSKDEDDYKPFVRQTSIPNLSVLPCGAIPPNPTELLGSSKFQKLLPALKTDFDWVVLDTPPVASLADTVILAALSDLFVLVIKQNENDRDLIRRTLKRLRDVNIEIAGAVLNAMDIEGSYFRSYYYAYDYYAKDEKGKGRKRKRLAKPGADPEDRSRRVAL